MNENTFHPPLLLIEDSGASPLPQVVNFPIPACLPPISLEVVSFSRRKPRPTVLRAIKKRLSTVPRHLLNRFLPGAKIARYPERSFMPPLLLLVAKIAAINELIPIRPITLPKQGKVGPLTSTDVYYGPYTTTNWVLLLIVTQKLLFRHPKITRFLLPALGR